MVYLIFYAVGLMAASAWGKAGAAATVAELERRLNSRLVDEIVGEVDYDFTYFHKGTHAYAIENVRRFQGEDKVRWDAASQTLVIRQETASDTAESAVLRLGPAGDAKQVLRTARQTRSTEAEAGVAALSDSAAAVADLMSSAALRVPRSAHTRSFGGDSTRTYGGRAARLRHYGDGRGDISSFDLGGLNAAALQRRSRSANMRHIDGLKLGVTLARPARSGMTRLTRIEQEHRLSRRRLMRLELRELYAAVPADALLDIKVRELKENGRQARVAVEWSYGDAPDLKRRATLKLRRAGDVWQVERAWDFIAALGAARKQIEASKRATR